MAIDYRINLASGLASAPEQRRRFYHGMLLYLALCSAALVLSAYLASVNLLAARRANMQRQVLERSMNAVSAHGRIFYKDPEAAHRQLERYASDLALLRDAFGRRSHFLPVMSRLFANFPENVALQDLSASADKKALSFGLVVPLSDQEKGDPVRKLQSAWSGDAELTERVRSIRPVTGERRLVGGEPAFFVQFECLLK